MEAPRWFDRYRAGHRTRVWQELRILGGAVRDSPWVAEAQAVCDLMARRARYNVEQIVRQLTAEGYIFHDTSGQKAVPGHVPPTPDAPELVTWLEEHIGPIPMTLSSWIRIVGDVWLVGTHPDWPESRRADPLVFEMEYTRLGFPVREVIGEEWDRWKNPRPGDEPIDHLFALTVAPDLYHKADVSGSGPYEIVVPDPCADGLFQWETLMPFVSYLNLAFEHGGFPSPIDGAGDGPVRQRLAEGLWQL